MKGGGGPREENSGGWRITSPSGNYGANGTIGSVGE